MRYVHIGHFFYNVNGNVIFGNRLTLSIFRFPNFSLDKLTNKLTDKLTNKLTDKLTDGQNQ